METSKIDSNLLTYYLQHVHRFLHSQKKVQTFPGLAKDIEEVLVQIASHDTIFPSEGFDDDCKSLLADIKAELIKNRKEYEIDCTFENLASGKRSLIYTKNRIQADTFQQLLPLRKPNSVTSTKTRSCDSQSSLISTSFKLNCLNATLKFIKDDTTLTLRYPDMATEQADFIVNMFEQSNTESGIGLGYKTMYAPLWEAMKIFGLKYKFTLRHSEPKHPDMKCLVLDKIPIITKTNKDNQDQQPGTPTSIIVTFSTDTEQNRRQITATNNQNTDESNPSLSTIEFEHLSKLKDDLQKFGPKYLMNMYKKIHDFVADSSSASLVLEPMNVQEMRIYQNWLTILTKSKYRSCFDDEGMTYVNGVLDVLKDGGFKIKFIKDKRTYGFSDDVIKKCPNNKVPKGGFLQGAILQKIPTEGRYKALNKIERCRKQNELMLLKKSSRSSSLNSRGSTASETFATKSGTAVTRSDTVVTQSDTLVTKSQAFVTKSETTLKEVGRPTKPEKSERPDKKSKMKLIEGLSQPVNSDKAMKMMMNMGWSGGALGVRGEGITEPIAPGIDQYLLDPRKRRGLGGPEVADKQLKDKQPQRKADKKIISDYHTNSLEVILKLLSSPQTSQELYLPQNVYKREVRFVRELVRSLNSSGKLTLNATRQIELLNEINGIMSKKNWHLTFEACDGIITITKTPLSDSLPSKIKSKKGKSTKKQINVPTPPKLVILPSGENDFQNFTNLNDLSKNNNDPSKIKFVKSSESCNNLPMKNQDYSMKKPTEKLVTSCPSPMVPSNFKSKFLAHILLLCEQDISQKTINFSNDLSENEKAYILEMIGLFNKREKCIGLPLELRFIEKINNAMNGYNIECVFTSVCSINLKKQYICKADNGADEAKENHNISNINHNLTTNHNINSVHNKSQNNETCQVINDDDQEVEYTFVDSVKYSTSIDDLEEVSLTASNNTVQATNNTNITSSLNLENPYEKALKSSFNEINDIIDNFLDSDQVTNKSDKDTNNSSQILYNRNPVAKNNDQDTENITVVIANDDDDYEVCSDDDNDNTKNDLAYEIQELRDLINEEESVKNKINDPKTNINDQNNLNIDDELKNDFKKESSPSKRSSSESECSSQETKKPKQYVKKIAIVPKSYPLENMTEKTAREIQISILNSIDNIHNSELPLLKCNGLQNGILLYCCYNEKSFNFIEDLLKINDFKIIYGIKKEKLSTIFMTIKMNSYFVENSDLTLNRLVKYNKGLDIANWKVIKRIFSDNGGNIFLVEMDKSSYDYIRVANFSLFAGIDKAVFGHYWD